MHAGSTPPFFVAISFVRSHREDAALHCCDGTSELKLSRLKIQGMRQHGKDRTGRDAVPALPVTAQAGELGKGVDSGGASHPLAHYHPAIRAEGSREGRQHGIGNVGILPRCGGTGI